MTTLSYKLPSRPHTAPNHFRRGRTLKAKEKDAGEDLHGAPARSGTGWSPNRGRPLRSKRALKNSNGHNQNQSSQGARGARKDTPRHGHSAQGKTSMDGVILDGSRAGPEAPRTVSPRQRRHARIRQMNGASPYAAAAAAAGLSPRLPGIAIAGTGADPLHTGQPYTHDRASSPQNIPHDRRSGGPGAQSGGGGSPRGRRAMQSQSPRARGWVKTRGAAASDEPPSNRVGEQHFASMVAGKSKQPPSESPPSSPPLPMEEVQAAADGAAEAAAAAEAKELGRSVLEVAESADLEELKLDLQAARSQAAKAEAEKELAEVQVQVAQQEFEMECRRMSRETQIVQDELDEVKAKFRAFQEEAERSRRDKERYIQVLWRAMEVHGIASPFSNAASIGLARAERELHGKLCLVSGAPGDGPRVLKQADFPAVAEAVGLPSFLGRRLYAHARAYVDTAAAEEEVEATTGGAGHVELGAFEKLWMTVFFPLDEKRCMFRVLCHEGGGGSAAEQSIRVGDLYQVVEDLLTTNRQLLVGTNIRVDERQLLQRCAAVLAQRIMHFCCRCGVALGRMSRIDFDSSELEEIIQLLHQGDGDAPPHDKVSAFFAVAEAEQVVNCFDTLDSDGDGFLTLEDLLASRNGGGAEGEDGTPGAGAIPRCGAFTLTQAAFEGVFSCSSKGHKSSAGHEMLLDLAGFSQLFHAYVYPHAPSATRYWFDVADTDRDGVLSFEDMTKLLQEQVYILNTHLEGQGEHPVFRLESLTQQVMDMVGPPPERVGAEVQGWSCSEVLGSRAGLVFFDVLFNYEVLLRYERHATATGGQPYIVCAMSA